MLRAITELVVTVAIAVGIAVAVQAVLVKPYEIPTGSMLPTVRVGQRVLANRLDTHPGIGEIVAFHPPAGANPEPGVCGDPHHPRAACDRPTPPRSSQTFIKRVVGLLGDRIAVSNGHVIRDGVKEHASYAAPCSEVPECNFPSLITVPNGDCYMMGDNRGNSDDSRLWGPVPQKWISCSKPTPAADRAPGASSAGGVDRAAARGVWWRTANDCSNL